MGWFLGVVLAAQVATSSVTETTDTTKARVTFYREFSSGVRAINQRQYARALTHFKAAQALTESSPDVHHYIALCLAQLKRHEEAKTALNLSKKLGNTSLEADEVEAVIHLRQGDEAAARQVLKGVESLPSTWLLATTGDNSAIMEAARFLSMSDRRGLITSTILATTAAIDGRRVQAQKLAELATTYRSRLGDVIWTNAIRDMNDRLGAGRVLFDTALSLRTTFDYTTNPQFRAAGESDVSNAVRLSNSFEAAMAVVFSDFRYDTAVYGLHRSYFTDQSLLSDYAINGLSWANRLTFVLSNRSRGAELALNLRLRDLYADNFSVHYAATIEGGPSLRLPISPQLDLEMGILGIATDFIDKSPPDDVVSSQNRDAVGQSAFVEITWLGNDITGEINAALRREDARGEAFDVTGVSLSGRILADLSGGLLLRTGAGVALGRFGPVGDARVLGPAATRTEGRFYGDISFLVQFTSWLRLSLENFFLQNSGRSGHAYTDNVVSVGAEVTY